MQSDQHVPLRLPHRYPHPTVLTNLVSQLTRCAIFTNCRPHNLTNSFLSAFPTVNPHAAGLTKLVSQLTREGQWSKGLEVFDALDAVGLLPDTTITNAAISACDKGGQWEKALQVGGVACCACESVGMNLCRSRVGAFGLYSHGLEALPGARSGRELWVAGLPRIRYGTEQRLHVAA